jgi:hypothetical protein
MIRFCKYYIGDITPKANTCEDQECQCPYVKDKSWEECDCYEPRK